MSKYNLNLPGDTSRITMHSDHMAGKVHIQHVQDVEPHLKYAAALRSRDNPNSLERGEGNFRHVAHIPDILIQIWRKQGVDVMNKQDWPKVVALLNDIDYQKVKTIDGKV